MSETNGDVGPEFCQRCGTPIDGRCVALRIEADATAARALAVEICPKCLESLERWINRHLKPANSYEDVRRGDGIELGVGLDDPSKRGGSRSTKRGKHAERFSRRSDLERQLDREVSFVNQNAFWVMGAIILVVGAVVTAIAFSKIHSLLPNDTGPAKPTVGSAEVRRAGPLV